MDEQGCDIKRLKQNTTTMQEQLKKYFEDNPNAKEVHVALGYLCKSIEVADKKLAGVSGHEISTYTRDQFCTDQDSKNPVQLIEKKSNEERSKQVAQFKKQSPEKQQRGISELKNAIAKKEASLPAETDQEKAAQSIAHLKGLLSEMQAVVDASSEAKK